MTSGHPPRPADGVSPPISQKDAAPSRGIERVKKRRDFLAANAGFRAPSAAFVLLVKPTERGEARAGFTVTKKIGNAVARNRARRRLKEAARQVLPQNGLPSADHIFIARKLDAERPFDALVADVRAALAKAARKL